MFSLRRMISEHPPPGVPGGFWCSLGSARTVILLLSLYCGLVAVFLLLALMFATSWIIDAPIGVKFGCGLGPIFCTLGMRLIYKKAKQKFCAKLEAFNFELCAECAYDLHGLPGTHRCPECGASYDKTAIRQQWELWAKGIAGE